MTVPLIVLFYQQSQNINQEVTSSQLDKAASEIRDSADEVYYLGSPSKKTITVYKGASFETFPEAVEYGKTRGIQAEFLDLKTYSERYKKAVDLH